MNRPYFLLLAVIAAAALASCASSSVKVPDQVKVPVPVACVRPEDRPSPPTRRTEADLMAMDRYRRTLAAWSDLKKLEAYSAELEAIVEACSRLPAAN